MKKKYPALECLKCSDVLVARYQHDFKWCGCHSVALDGPPDRPRMIGDRANWRLFDVEE